MNTTVDARGLACPEPVLRTREALLAGESDVVEVLVDTMTSVENVSRMAQSQGWKIVSRDLHEDCWHLILQR